MKSISLVLCSLALVFLLGIPQIINAQTGNGSGVNDGTGSGVNDGTGSGTDGSNGSGETVSLTNPLQSSSIEEFILKIIDILLVFAIPIIVLFIMYAGFLYVTARGDEGKIKTAHSALTWSIVGGVIILGAKLILEVVKNTVTSL